MELDAIIEAGVGELLEVGDGERGVLLEEVGDDGALSRLERCLFGHGGKIAGESGGWGASEPGAFSSRASRRLSLPASGRRAIYPLGKTRANSSAQSGSRRPRRA